MQDFPENTSGIPEKTIRQIPPPRTYFNYQQSDGNEQLRDDRPSNLRARPRVDYSKGKITQG